jgi:riboflavin biosynthesis pyrimidine reductase
LLVVVTASLSLDRHLPLFADPGYRPLIVTVGSAPTDRRRALEEVADIVVAGDHQVELGSALGQISDRGLEIVLSEGGPSLNGQLIVDDLVDEWNLSLSPILAAGASKRPAMGSELVPPGLTMALSRVWHQDNVLFCRWVRSRSA